VDEEDTDENHCTAEAFLKAQHDKAPKVQPVGIGLFGGVLGYDKLGLPQKLILMLMRSQEGDNRDRDAIREWVDEVRPVLAPSHDQGSSPLDVGRAHSLGWPLTEPGPAAPRVVSVRGSDLKARLRLRTPSPPEFPKGRFFATIESRFRWRALDHATDWPAVAQPVSASTRKQGSPNGPSQKEPGRLDQRR
jgi:hypothetical protein